VVWATGCGVGEGGAVARSRLDPQGPGLHGNGRSDRSGEVSRGGCGRDRPRIPLGAGRGGDRGWTAAEGKPSRPGPQSGAGVATLADMARLVRQLRRRQARQGGEAMLTYRELAAKTGCSRGIIGEYFAGDVLPPTDRFDVLTRLATARDRVEEHRRRRPPTNGGPRQPVAPTRLPGRVGCRPQRPTAVSTLAPEDRRGQQCPTGPPSPCPCMIEYRTS
jgi:hypothetical protein